MRRPVIFGNYLLLERISVGGMAEIFKSKSFGIEGFEKVLAIKRILPSLAEDDDFITMFIDEAKISGQLSHANIAQIYELGKIEDSHFIAMEFVWGKDVLQLQNRYRRFGQKMPTVVAAFIASKVCEGLDYAHRKRDALGAPLDIIHRDISPQNVLVSYEGEVKLIDFGIAKAAARTAKTQAGVLKGKFGYMSPEQVRGLPLDRRSDIFALGTLLWETCAGERLFTGESDFAVLERVRNAVVKPPSLKNPAIDPALDAIVMRALQRDPVDRFSWASEMSDALQTYLASVPESFGPANLSAVLKELFAVEMEAERVAMERYRLLRREDVEAFAYLPPEPSGQAVSLLGRDAPGRSSVEDAEDSDLDEQALAELLAREDLDVVSSADEDFDDGSTELAEPGFLYGGAPSAASEFDDGATELGGPEFLFDVGGSQREDGVTQIFGDQRDASAGASGGRQSEAHRGPRGEGHQPSTMLFSESYRQAGGDAPGMASVVYASAGSRSGSLPQPTSGTMPLMAPHSSLFKDILIGVLAAAVLALLGVVGYSVLNRSTANSPATLVINLSGDKVAEVVIDGRSYGRVSPGKPKAISELRGGTHRVALLGGDEPVVRTVHVAAGKSAIVDMSLGDSAATVKQPRAAAAFVKLSVDPAAARVVVDGAMVSASELERPLRLAAGAAHVITASREGFATWRMQISLQNGQRVAHSVKLQPSNTGAIHAQSDPIGAAVVFDGRTMGRTPLWLEEMKTGLHTFSVSADGYRTLQVKVRVERGAVARTSWVLAVDRHSGDDTKVAKAKAAEASTAEAKAAAVKAAAVKAAAVKAAAAAKGPRKVAAVKAAAAAKGPRKVVSRPVASGKDGYLVANTSPWARVLVDGIDTGRTTPIPPKRRLALKPGRRRITFVVGKKRHEVYVRIKSGQTARIIKDLE